MPIPVIVAVFEKGAAFYPWILPALKTSVWIVAIWVLKTYFSGSANTAERLMRSKVILITGGTSGIGASVAQDMAARGAQIILLTQYALSDPFLVEYLEDLRERSQNQFVYAEQVDLASLHSIRTFATKWVDNANPRRLDAIILCADTFTTKYGSHALTQDLLEPTWAVNYLANFHLLSILSPALKNQPPDREVRIIFATCASYIGGKLGALTKSADPLPAGRRYETSKLACLVFAQALQRVLDNFKRADKQPNNVRVFTVDPGYSRTPGMRRWMTMGSLWGLLLYILTLPLWWLMLKSPAQGAQGFLTALMDANLGRGPGGIHIKECRKSDLLNAGAIMAEDVQKTLWEYSEQQIMAVERESAARRAQSTNQGIGENMKAK